jgi:hypothetical protein
MHQETRESLSLPPVQRFVRPNIQNNNFTRLFFLGVKLCVITCEILYIMCYWGDHLRWMRSVGHIILHGNA